ncbi:MAG: hypothetical protein ACPL1Z_01300 [Candidatus Bathyarchaeales archaeon]
MVVTLVSLTLFTSTTAQVTVNHIWVMVYGRVKNYGLNYANGWCSVYAKVDEWARAFVVWTPVKGVQIPEIINFYAAELNETRSVELNYNGANLYIEGLWNVYNVTYIFEPGTTPGNYTLDVELMVDRSYGTLTVINNWEAFAVNIHGLDVISGEVIHYAVRSEVAIPLGDVSGSSPGEPDRKIDIWDLVHTAKTYGQRPGTNFNFDTFSMDFNFDFQIDITDLGTIAVNIGEGY